METSQPKYNLFSCVTNVSSRILNKHVLFDICHTIQFGSVAANIFRVYTIFFLLFPAENKSMK